MSGAWPVADRKLALVMPIVDFPFRPEPVIHITSVPAAPLLPELVCTLGDLFFQAQVFMHMKYRGWHMFFGFLFHLEVVILLWIKRRSSRSQSRKIRHIGCGRSRRR
jgi:hypothetical protein